VVTLGQPAHHWQPGGPGHALQLVQDQSLGLLPTNLGAISTDTGCLSSEDKFHPEDKVYLPSMLSKCACMDL